MRLKQEEYDLKIKNLISKGFWNLNSLSLSFPKDIVDKTLGTLFNLTNKEDKLIWKLSKSSTYSTKSSYFAISNVENLREDFNLKWI